MRRALARTSPLVLALLSLSSSCIDRGAYACHANVDCNSAEGGACEPIGACSYPDDACASGRRYGGYAGPLSHVCVETDDTTAVVTDPTTTADPTVATNASSDDAGGSSTTATDTGCVDGCPIPGGTELWSLTFDGDMHGNDRLASVITSAGGDIFAAGVYASTTADALLVRVTPDGELVAQRVHDVQGGDDDLTALQQGPDGTIWTCGRGNTSTGGLHAWLGQFDVQLADDAPKSSVIIDHVVCRTLGIAGVGTWIAAGDDGDYGGGSWMYTFAHWDADGGNVTLTTEPVDDRWSASALTGDGSLLLAGVQAGDGTVTTSDGSMLGDNVLGDGAGARPQGLAAIGDTVVVGGFENTAGQADRWIGAFDTSGAPLWSWRATPPVAIGDEVESVAIDGTGAVIAVGFVADDVRRRWAMKLDPDGNELWSRTWPAATDALDAARDVTVLPDDGIVVVGEITTDASAQDAWIARLAP